MAAKTEKLPEAFVGRQGAQETFVVLAPFYFELWASGEGGGHQKQQTRVLSSRSTIEF